jgi:hypothetical protein
VSGAVQGTAGYRGTTVRLLWAEISQSV